MFSMKNAALVGLAAADRTLFTPVASPYAQVASPYAQVAPVYEPAAAGYALSADAYAQPQEFVQFVQPEPQGADSTWLWAGAGVLAVAGAVAAARSGEPSPVAALDEADIESAIATLGVGGAEFQTLKRDKANKGGLLGFLMSGRVNKDGRYDNELELLSGVGRRPSDSDESLRNRFKILYDTRTKPKALAPKKRATLKAKNVTTWRSKNPDARLYK